jgi:hypothetical protein
LDEKVYTAKFSWKYVLSQRGLEGISTDDNLQGHVGRERAKKDMKMREERVDDPFLGPEWVGRSVSGLLSPEL